LLCFGLVLPVAAGTSGVAQAPRPANVATAPENTHISAIDALKAIGQLTEQNRHWRNQPSS
jgi:hypothetical protein